MRLISYENQSTFKKLKVLVNKWAGCDKCPFAKHRATMVWAKGNANAGIVLIGEAPGKNEDQQGIPFIGKAGEILEEGMKAAKLSLDDCFVCNVMACRPCDSLQGNNRPPKAHTEIPNCRPRLQSILRITKPKVVIMMGRTATTAVYGYPGAPDVLKRRGVYLIKTMHPMATIYNKDRKNDWNTFWLTMRSFLKNNVDFTKTPRLDWNIPLVRG